jgi:hypothetical protein
MAKEMMSCIERFLVLSGLIKTRDNQGLAAN